MLCWNDVRTEVWKVQTAVTSNYKLLAHLLLDNGAASFFDRASISSDPNLLGHPPGYSIFLAVAHGLFGESDTAIQIIQMFADSLAAVVVCLIAAELFPFEVAVIAGTLAVLSPQFSWNSALLLPDTLAVLPMLLAIWLIIRGWKRRALLHLLAAGVLLGVSCWLRANSLLFAPFLVLLVPLLFEKGRRIRPALALLVGTAFVIAPLTVRNALVFHCFIPVSLGAGQTLVEGIGDYDAGGKFGLPKTDIELTQQEAKNNGRPDYANSLFTPDGIERDRARLARGFTVVRSHPFWFLWVMARRASSMIRLERTPLTSTATVTEGRMHYPRFALRLLQKLYVTALVLPLVAIGLIILVRSRQWRALAVLLAVPGYYFCV